MKTQPKLNAKMRAILLDWISEVHQSVDYKPLTLYRTGQIVDRVRSDALP